MQSWQDQLRNIITEPEELCRLLELDFSELKEIAPAIKQFPLRVPQAFIARMQKGNLHDPLLLQVLPQSIEMQTYPGYSQQALQENDFNPVPGLLHKYKGRVLLTAAGSCAINCRYCFRRHFPYQEQVPSTNGWQKALEYIQQNSSIEEVILSGGEPLILKDDVLFNLIYAIQKIPHITTLRIHTRLPVVIPERISSSLTLALEKLRLKTVIVLHINHPHEIDARVEKAVTLCRHHGIHVLNQTVFLKGVNDDAETLIALSKKLFSVGILPYYLHALDPVAGSAHFAVDDLQLLAIHQELQSSLPGYLVPKLVREIPGKAFKSPIVK